MFPDHINEWFEKYLTSRAISPDLANQHGFHLIGPDEINRLFARADAHQIEAGILIPLGDERFQLRCYRPPVGKVEGAQDLLEFESKNFWDAIYGIPENEPFTYEWKVRAKALGVGWHRFEGRLVEVTEDDARRKNMYPVDVDYVKLSTKYGVTFRPSKFLFQRGKGPSPYVPVPLQGNRPLIIAEGATRVLAVLGTGHPVDVVGIHGAGMWGSAGVLHPVLVDAAKNATSVTVVLDGDWVSNALVREQLIRLTAALTTENADVRIGTPGEGKSGLDDLLATGRKLGDFLADCLPADLDKAISLLYRERYGSEPDDIEVFHCARPSDPTALLSLGAALPIPEYERFRKRLAQALDRDLAALPLHPEPAGKLCRRDKANKYIPATAVDVVNAAPHYIFPALPYLVHADAKGQGQYYANDNGILSLVVPGAIRPAISEKLGILLNSVPVNSQIAELETQFELTASRHEIEPLRFTGKTNLAMVEIPSPKSGPTPAWDEFLDRCSCPDTFLAWIWTIFLPERDTGRQALYLRSIEGNDGKSTIIDYLLNLLGGADHGVALSISMKNADESRFAMQSFCEYTRLVYLDDVQSTTLLKSQRFRDLTAGSTIPIEKKGKQETHMRVHPRVLVGSNIQLLYDFQDRAEFTRTLQIDIAPNPSPQSDSRWPAKLRDETTAFLARCQGAYARIGDGPDVTLTSKTREIMEAAGIGREEEYADLLEHIEIDEHGIMLSRDFNRIWDELRPNADRFKKANFEHFLRVRKARSGVQKKLEGSNHRVWTGISLTSSGATCLAYKKGGSR